MPKTTQRWLQIQVWLTILFLPHYHPRAQKEQRPETSVQSHPLFQYFKVRASHQSLMPGASVAGEQDSGAWGCLGQSERGG